MAIRFDLLKEQILIILYDYMLTSDDESFWYSRQSIKDALSTEVSGALLTRALDALRVEQLVEEGVGDPEGEPENTPVFALTQHGIAEAEVILIRKGWRIEDYQPAPSADRIISRLNEPDLHAAISKAVSDLAKDVRESNEAGLLLGEDKELITGEIEVAEALTRRESFRLNRLLGLLLPALKFVGAKFFGSAIGEAAKHLINLLSKIS